MPRRAMTDAAKQEKSNAILDKAATMFLQYDYDKIRMSDIAKEMGISNGILFVYFKSKETLFFMLLLREYNARFSRLILRLQNTDISTVDKILRSSF